MKGKYKRAKEWCGGCDRVLLAIGKRCPVCGYKMDTKQKKPNKAKILTDASN